MANVIEEIQKECRRVRENLIPVYRSIGPAGGIAIALMQMETGRAEAALAEGDTIQMIASLQSLREFSL